MAKEKDYSNDSFALISYKHPKYRKLHYYIIPTVDSAANEIIIGNKIYLLYGEHAAGTYQEMSRLAN